MQILNDSSPEIQALMQRFDKVETRIRQLVTKTAAQDWIPEKELCKRLKVSARTLANYRSENKLGFTKVLGKIFYRAWDVQRLLDGHYCAPF